MGVERVHPPEVFLPNHLSRPVEAIQSARAKESEDSFAISDRRIVGQAAGGMAAFMGKFFPNYFLPGNFSLPALDSQEDVLVLVSDPDIVVGPGSLVVNWGLCFADRDCGRKV